MNSATPGSGKTKLYYRPDIDGLRAIAVLSVVTYHACPTLLPGGFIGVDVFFVISGYLISSIIFRGVHERTFRFTNFYARRIRRIFPALILVLTATFTGGYVLLLADEYALLGKHVASGAVFLSNFTLLGETGYFDTASELKPLLHLWSLGIEEQFYIIWPLAAVLAFRSRRSLLWITCCIGLCSFAINIGRIDGHLVQTFYNPVTRFWELMAGAVLSCVTLFFRMPRWTSKPLLHDLFSWVGLVIIFGTVLILNRDEIFPGWWATLPVLGAVFLIGSGSDSWINTRFLSQRWMIWIGLISYPLYLWHWPLLSFVRIVEAGHPPLYLEISSVVVAFFLAWATYYFVEKRIRHNPSPLTVVILVILMTGIGITGKTIELQEGLPQRRSVAHFQDFEKQIVRDDATDSNCDAYVTSRGENRKFYYCRSNELEQKKWLAIVGDSHAHVLFPGFSEQAAARGYGTLLLANTSCPPLLGSATGKTKSERSQCTNSIEQVFRLVEGEPRISKVLFATRGMIYISGQEFGASAKTRVIFFQSVTGEEAPPATVFFSSLQTTIKRLLASGKKVALFIENPEMGLKPKDCNKRPFTFTGRLPRFRVSYKDYQKRMSHYRQNMESIAADFPSVLLLDPEKMLCNTQNCNGILNGHLLYSDDDHFSVAGSKYIARGMADLLFAE
jgi:peptidoglycan/LPS O-acetylase OafA/YrhL